jgi:capsular exopolysaccharide synthesis family protein
MNGPNSDQKMMQPWEQDQPLDTAGENLPFMEYVQALWYHKKLIVAITVFVAAVGWVQVNQIRSMYSASSLLMIGVPQTNVVDIEAVLTKNYGGDQVVTEMQVIKSRVLAQKIVERLRLYEYEEFNPGLRTPEKSLFDFTRYLNPRTWIPASWKQTIKEALGRETVQNPPKPPIESEVLQRKINTAINIFLGRIQVEEIEYAKVMRISFTSWDPKMAARIANYIPEAYILDQLEAKFEATEKANAWLTEQIEDLERKVVDSERAIEIFRQEKGLDEVSGGGILEQQRSELSSQLIVARAELAEIEARRDQIDRVLAGSGNIGAMTEILSSTMIQNLRSQELEVLARESELSLVYGPRHPRMLQVQAELEEIRERIRLEVQNVSQGLDNEAEFARARIANLESGLRQVQGEYSDLGQEAVQLRALEREAAANRALFETFLNRFKETSTTQGTETSDARVLSEAQVPGGPSYPNRKQKLTNITLMGFLGACALVLAMQFMNPGLRTPEQVQRVLGEYVVGVIPSAAGKVDLHDLVLEKPQSNLVEAINSLKFSLALSNPDIHVKAIQVTSSIPEEGKTSLALALGRVEAASGRRAILVDGDLRRSSIVKKLGLESGQKGLSDLVVAGKADIADFILRDEKGGMDYMPVGTAQYANAGDIFSSIRMQHIIDQLKVEYDIVIFDSPPVMAVADARIIGRLMDKTLFVVRWDKTPKKVAKAALEQLKRHGTNVAGVVLQQVDLERYGRIGGGSSGYYYHYRRYGKYYSS